MALNLIDLAKDYLTPDTISKMAGLVGESPAATQRAPGWSDHELRWRDRSRAACWWPHRPCYPCGLRVSHSARHYGVAIPSNGHLWASMDGLTTCRLEMWKETVS